MVGHTAVKHNWTSSTSQQIIKPYSITPLRHTPHSLFLIPYSLLLAPYSLLLLPTPCSYSLLPAPYSLLPIPYSLLLTPYSLLPAPYSLLPAPYLTAKVARISHISQLFLKKNRHLPPSPLSHNTQKKDVACYVLTILYVN